MNGRHDLIRERAFHLWLADGCPEGRDAEHWRKAADLIAHEDGSPPAEDVPPGTAGGDASTPAAGPHAGSHLTNPDATPGTGMLPDIGSDDPNQQPSG